MVRPWVYQLHSREGPVFKTSCSTQNGPHVFVYAFCFILIFFIILLFYCYSFSVFIFFLQFLCFLILTGFCFSFREKGHEAEWGKKCVEYGKSFRGKIIINKIKKISRHKVIWVGRWRLLEKIKRAIGSDYDQNKLCECDCYLWLSTLLHLQLTKVNRLYKLVRNFFIELFGEDPS